MPSLVCTKLNPRHVVVSDFPDPTILSNIHSSITENRVSSDLITVVGYRWGDAVGPLLSPLVSCSEADSCSNVSAPLITPTDPLHTDNATNPPPHFDVILLSELLWKDTYPLHRALLESVQACLRPDGQGIVLASLAHRPSPDGHTRQHDMEFFELATSSEFDFVVELLQTNSDMQDSLSGSEQCGEERMCVYLYALRRRSMCPAVLQVPR